MRRLRAGWTSFRRIHLAALTADWRRTLLSVIGVALGVTVVLGVLVLKSELLVDRVDPLADVFARQLEPGVDHALDRGLDGVALHAHEVDEGVVQVEDDRADHGRDDPVTWSRARSRGPG